MKRYQSDTPGWSKCGLDERIPSRTILVSFSQCLWRHIKSSRTRTAMKGEGSAIVSMENHLSPLSLSLFLCFFLYVCLSFCLLFCLSVFLSFCLPFCLSGFLSFCAFCIYFFMLLFIFVFLYFCIYCLSFCNSFFMYVCPIISFFLSFCALHVGYVFKENPQEIW